MSSKEQRRLLGLIAALTFVLIASRMAANPENWTWLFRGDNPSQKNTASKTQSKTTPAKAKKPGERKKLVINEPSPPKPPGKKEPPPPLVPLDSQSLEIPPDLLEVVKDRTWDIRPEESRAYYQVLAHAAAISQDKLQRASRDDIPFSVLMNAAEEHRGRILTLEGELHEIRRIPDLIPEELLNSTPSQNTNTKDRKSKQGRILYDAWIRMADSENTPYRVVFSQLPEEVGAVEQSKKFNPPVPIRVTGYFFKVQRYAIDETRSHYAPLFLAGRIQILERRTDANRSVSAAPYIVGFVIFLLLAFSVAIWRFSSGDKAFQKNHLKRLAEPTAEEKNALNDLPATNTEDMFSQLGKMDNSPTTNNSET
ncbi:MAG: hypothetical protein Tsb009_30910 [Planctomycetaceae bacterium]